MHDRDRKASHTQRAMTMRAIEMGMQIVNMTGAFIGTDRIFQRTGPIVNAVDEMMLQKQGKCTRNRGLVNSHQSVGNIKQRHGATAAEHCPQYHKAQRRRLYFPQSQHIQIFLFFGHFSIKSLQI